MSDHTMSVPQGTFELRRHPERDPEELRAGMPRTSCCCTDWPAWTPASTRNGSRSSTAGPRSCSTTRSARSRCCLPNVPRAWWSTPTAPRSRSARTWHAMRSTPPRWACTPRSTSSVTSTARSRCSWSDARSLALPGAPAPGGAAAAHARRDRRRRRDGQAPAHLDPGGVRTGAGADHDQPGAPPCPHHRVLARPDNRSGAVGLAHHVPVRARCPRRDQLARGFRSIAPGPWHRSSARSPARDRRPRGDRRPGLRQWGPGHLRRDRQRRGRGHLRRRLGTRDRLGRGDPSGEPRRGPRCDLHPRQRPVRRTRCPRRRLGRPGADQPTVPRAPGDGRRGRVEMFTDAHRALQVGGELWVVGNRHLAHHAKLQRIFRNCEVVASSPKFVVLRAVRR